MTPPVVSPKARADLAGVWDVTVARWGTVQAVAYVRRIEAAFGHLAQDPEIGRRCDEIRPGYRRYRVGSHVIFYRISGGTVGVVRVLHVRMDFPRHLWFGWR